MWRHASLRLSHTRFGGAVVQVFDPANKDVFPIRRATRWLAVAVLIILPLVAYRAAFSGYFMLDDFGMLAIVRFLEVPLQPFVAEHIPGGLFYRPVGMLFWWLSERVFGSVPFWHYLCNLILHVAAAFSLGSLVSRLCANRLVGFGVALVFAVHPVAIGTTLWLSDRFDLLALLFGLQATRVAFKHSIDGRLRSLVCTLLFLAIALLSKEIALAVLAAIAVMWIFADRAEFSWRLKIPALIAISLLAAAYLVLRNAVISTVGTESLFALKPAVELLHDGVHGWLRGWIDYASYWPRLSAWRAIVAVFSASALFLFALFALRAPWDARRRQIVLLGLAMWITPALLQWPIIGLLDLRIGSDPRPIDLVVNARYFYVALAGALIALAGLFFPIYTAQRNIVRRCISGAVIALVLIGLLASQHLARSYRNETLQQRTLTEAAVTAIQKIDFPSRGCQIYLLDTHNWMFAWVSDEAIKAVAPDLGRIAGCLIQTEHTPWYHLVVLDPVDIPALTPLTPVAGVERGSGELMIGSARILVLNLLPQARPDASPDARFLSFNNGQFVDVTQEVREGRRVVSFICNRWASQCEQ